MTDIIYILCKSVFRVVFNRIRAPPYHLLRTIIMSSNIRIGGKEYPKKRTYFLTLEKMYAALPEDGRPSDSQAALLALK